MASFSQLKRRLCNRTTFLRKRKVCGLVFCIATGILFIKQLLIEGSQRQPVHQMTSPDAALNAPKTTQIDHEKRQRDRLQRIRKYCNDSKNNAEIFHQFPTRNHFNFVVSDKHKFIICYVPKTGASQWKDSLLNILSIRPVTPDHDIDLFDYHLFKFLNSYKPKERQEKLASYQKFFFVREPFERLLSAYRDKFVGKTTQLYNKLGKDIVNKVRRSAGKTDSCVECSGPTFDEFTSYIDTLPKKATWDMHWRPAHQTCYPCAINYDYIGYFDTAKEDADYILEKLHLDKEVKFPSFNGSRTPELLRGYYSQIPLDRIIRIAEIYRTDFEMFGYKYPDPIKKLFRDWV